MAHNSQKPSSLSVSSASEHEDYSGASFTGNGRFDSQILGVHKRPQTSSDPTGVFFSKATLGRAGIAELRAVSYNTYRTSKECSHYSPHFTPEWRSLVHRRQCYDLSIWGCRPRMYLPVSIGRNTLGGSSDFMSAVARLIVQLSHRLA